MAKSKQSRSANQQWINRIWYERSFISLFLLPLSVLFWFAITLRKTIYFTIPSLRQKFSVPIIVVGNITVGGTGKTPMVIYLCEELAKLGIKPGVASRGYGADINSTISIRADHRAKQVGDEPMMIFARTNQPVVVGPDRKDVIGELIKEHQCNVVICDDGLQDYRFVHDIEILMVDGDRQFGNGWLLPAGPLRERIKRASDCDFKVVTATECLEISGDTMKFDVQELVNLREHKRRVSVRSFVSQTVHAVAGIANPERFFALLRSHGLNIIEHAFPDHAVYTANDLEFADQYPVLMTEKDAVKCMGFGLSNVWYLPVRAKLPESFIPRIENLLRGLNG